MSSNSVYGQCLDAVKSAIDALSITGLTTVIQHVPMRVDQAMPMVSICPGPDPEVVTDSTNSREEVTYTIAIAILAAHDAAVLDDRLLWRQKIRRALHHQPLSGITGGTFLYAKVRPDRPVGWDELVRDTLFLSAMACRITVREARTTA